MTESELIQARRASGRSEKMASRWLAVSEEAGFFFDPAWRTRGILGPLCGSAELPSGSIFVQ